MIESATAPVQVQFHHLAKELAASDLITLPETLDVEMQLYAYSALAIGEIVAAAVEHRKDHPPLGLLTMRGKNAQIKKGLSITETFKDIDLKFAETLEFYAAAVLSGFQDNLAGDSCNSLKETKYKISQQLGELPEKYAHYKDAFGLLRAGIATGITEISRTLQTIPAVYQKEFPGEQPISEELKQIARNSYPLVVQLASMDLGKFAFLSTELDAKRLRYQLVNTPRGLALALPSSLNYQHSTDSKGCPALVDLGLGSAVKRIWKWYLEIAAEIYEQKFGTAKF